MKAKDMRYKLDLKIRKILLRSPLSIVGRPFFYFRNHVLRSSLTRASEKYLSELNCTEFAGIEALNEIRDRKLHELMKKVYINVPYYRGVMLERSLTPDDFTSASDLVKLPILTKSIVREHYSDMLNLQLDKSKLIKVSTGGTTGAPLHLLFDQRAKAVSLAHWARWKRYAGIAETDRCFFIATDYSAYDNPDYEGSFSGSSTYMGASFGLDDERLEKYLINMQWFKPKYIRGFAFACYLVAEYLVRKGVCIPMKAVITSGDMVYPYFRESVRRAFDCEIFDHYGQNEDIVTANECSAHQGLHVNTESCHVEILSESNSLCPPGESGHIVGTHLENTSMPLIRYDTSDMGRMAVDSCSCGRNHPRILALDGRKDDWITLKNGKKIGHQLSVTMKKFQHQVRETQFIQESYDLLRVKVVPLNDFNTQVQNEFEANIRAQVGQGIDIEFELVTEIAKTTRGKHRLIISKVSPVMAEVR